MRGGYGYAQLNNLGVRPWLGVCQRDCQSVRTTFSPLSLNYANTAFLKPTNKQTHEHIHRETYVEFGHDTSIAVALTGLGLFKYKRGTQPLPPPRASCTRPDHERTSREHNKTYIDYTAHLQRDDAYSASGPPNPSRKWRTSAQEHFASHLVTTYVLVQCLSHHPVIPSFHYLFSPYPVIPSSDFL